MPLLVPLSDLIGLSRQVTVLAYQYGAGLCELLTPTNGALMAMLAASRRALRGLAPVRGAGLLGPLSPSRRWRIAVAVATGCAERLGLRQAEQVLEHFQVGHADVAPRSLPLRRRR